GLPGGDAAPREVRALRERAPVVRAGAEGGRRGLPGPRGRRRTFVTRRRLGARPRRHAVRFRARRPPERLLGAVAHRALTGVVLVGGASTRFGSPKALAEVEGETFLARAKRVLQEACDEVLVVGKAGELPFEVIDDASA